MSEDGGSLLIPLSDGGVQTGELDARIGSGKAPVNGRHALVAIVLPALHLLTQLIDGRNVVLQPLPRQHRQFNLGDIEPGLCAWACSGSPGDPATA